MTDDIRREYQNIIWQLSQGSRKVWEMDPRDPDVVVEYRYEFFKMYRGRYTWVSNSSECWSNSDYGFAWGTMTECPEVPEVTQ